MTTNEYSHWLKANRRSLDNRANKKKNDFKKSQEILNINNKELRNANNSKTLGDKKQSRSKTNLFEKVSNLFSYFPYIFFLI